MTVDLGGTAAARTIAGLVLFDIDGTLLAHCGPPPAPGRRALTLTMHELFGIADACAGMRFAGGTDRGLVRFILERAGMTSDEETMARALARYVDHLEPAVKPGLYRPIGDVLGTVAALRACGAAVGLATGNVRDGARLKLASAGLHCAFDLALGGFGCDAERRADIVRIAVDRCGFGSPSAGCVVVVGDTARDVEAARAVGAQVVGVAADAHARAELDAAGADAIVASCGEELVAAIVSLHCRIAGAVGK